MKKFVIILLILICTSCGLAGYIGFYDFVAPKADVKKKLIKIINLNRQYLAPKQWNNYQLHGDSLNDIYVYFKGDPEELYCIRFNNYEDVQDHKDKTVLAFMLVFYGERGNMQVI